MHIRFSNIMSIFRRTKHTLLFSFRSNSNLLTNDASIIPLGLILRDVDVFDAGVRDHDGILVPTVSHCLQVSVVVCPYISRWTMARSCFFGSIISRSLVKNSKLLPIFKTSIKYPLAQQGRYPVGAGDEKKQPPGESGGCGGGCDVGLEPTTTRTTIWCSTN